MGISNVDSSYKPGTYFLQTSNNFPCWYDFKVESKKGKICLNVKFFLPVYHGQTRTSEM